MRNENNFSGHERFKELGALANSGTLSASERLELKHHLRICEDCREIHDQYQLLSAVGMPFLAAAYGDPQEREDWDDSCAREKLLVRIAETQRPSRDASASPLWSPAPAHLLLEFAANPWIKGGLAACLGIAVAFGAYSISRRTHNGEKRISHSSQPLVQKLAVEKQSPAQLAELQATRTSFTSCRSR